MKKSYRFISFLVANAFLNTQMYALAETTKVAVQTANLIAGISNHDARALVEATKNIEKILDENFATVQKKNEADDQELHKVANREAKIAKMNKRIQKHMARSIGRLNDKIDHLSDAELQEQLDQINKSKMPVKNINTREELKASVQDKLPQLAATLSPKIVDAGGVVPYVFQLKKNIKEARQKVEVSLKSSKEQDRKIAADPVLEGLIGLIVLLLIIMLIFGLWAVLWPVIGVVAIALVIYILIE